MRLVAIFGLVLTLGISSTATAMPDSLSKPSYVAPQDIIPAPQDIAYPGTMTLTVDALDHEQGIFRVIQTIPVAKAGRLTLLYPEWLPGNHAPRGEIEKLTGLEITANGEKLAWVRDDVDVFAFHLDVPENVGTITAKFQFVSATTGSHGRIVMAPSMLNLRWHQVSLYPAGYYVRQIPVEATAIYPDGWQAASALRPKSASGGTISYEKTDYDTLVDSPVFAGRYFQTHQLTSRVHLNIVADDAKFLKPKKDQIAPHIKLVKEAEALFGSHPYDRYDFLLALTDEMGGIGLEHHRSSENGVNREYFTDWDSGPGRRNLLPHEITHAWNGKYRRPAGMWTPDFRQPMRDNLLWVYEGQTQFWGYVLGARSGLYSKQDTLDAIAAIAAGMDQRVGRSWRPLIDTTHDPIIAARRPKPWTSWQRAEDYYNEGLLIWLEADQIIRRESAGKKTLEDFARAFFGGRNGDWGVVTYERDDVIAALDKVQPYDWDAFIEQRVYRTSAEAPKDGLVLGGYRLVYVDRPSAYILANDKRRKQVDLSHSIGLIMGSKGTIKSVIWDSPAFRAGLKSGLSISAVNGKAYSDDALKQAIEENRGGEGMIDIFAKNGEAYHNFMVDHSGGLRYPALEKITGEGVDQEGGIDRLLQPKTR
ncbi:M61 family metallopeptidase [Sphingorhabdus sp. SMR4y]|uniref:M61 family metallopeptidase n=1 Tax=Sphingorhabdus sp. SMR4y TaxID=2584094 RepID=UPI000B5C4347|nr:M61 family metallopeptidase [Sphingorhabdus sp. SMR4y]ASK89217.1 M61 glycyl aminopeptidase [Sphingorhabdus sp. SMR4y]